MFWSSNFEHREGRIYSPPLAHTKEQIAEEALREAKVALRVSFDARKDEREAKSEAIRFTVEAGEDPKKAELRILKALQKARRKLTKGD